jgi:CubicO group peptidase (beta-lactamase class C family)
MSKTVKTSTILNTTIDYRVGGFILLLCLLLLPLISFGTEEFPDTPAGDRASEILELINGSTSQSVEDYIGAAFAPSFRDGFPMQAHKSAFSMTRDSFGKLEIHEIEQSTPDNMAVVFKSADKEAYLRMVVQVEPDEPHRVLSLGFVPVQAPVENDAGSEGTVKSPANIDRENIDKKFSAKADKGEFSGVVLVAKDGRVIFQKAYGYASKESYKKNTPETRFNIGSCNKMFTSVAVAQLMERGKMDIDDPIGKYLDGFPEDIASRVTIRHLLQMKAGWGDYWGNEYYLSHRDDLKTVADYMSFIRNIPLDFEPGSNMQHCNTCFEVLGAIIEAVSGMDYYEYIRKYVYRPAGMKDTDSYGRDGAVENIATGYTNMREDGTRGSGFEHDNRPSLPVKGTPAGGGYSTVGDLLKYDTALRNFELLGRDYTYFAMNGFVGSPDEPSDPAGVSRAVGGAPGVCAFYGRDMNGGYTFIMLSNYDLPTGLDDMNEIIAEVGL